MPTPAVLRHTDAGVINTPTRRVGTAVRAEAARQRGLFESKVRAAATALPADSRAALRDMLTALAEFADAHASEAAQRRKWMMMAYWKVIGVYARHFRRLLQHADGSQKGRRRL